MDIGVKDDSLLSRSVKTLEIISFNPAYQKELSCQSSLQEQDFGISWWQQSQRRRHLSRVRSCDIKQPRQPTSMNIEQSRLLNDPLLSQVIVFARLNPLGM